MRVSARHRRSVSALPGLSALLVLLSGCATTTRIPGPPGQPAASDKVDVVIDATGLTTLQLRNFEAMGVAQKDPEGCWAACATMVHRWYGRQTSEAELIAAIKERTAGGGGDRAIAAGEHEVYLALVPEQKAVLDQLWARWNQQFGEALARGEQPPEYSDEGYLEGGDLPTLEDLLGQGALVLLSRAFSNMTIEDAHADLQAGEPVVVGLNEPPEWDPEGPPSGHAYVLYGLTYRYDPDHPDAGEGGYVYESVQLLDPWREPGDSAPSAVPVTRVVSSFMQRADFMVSRPQAQATLAREAEILNLNDTAMAGEP